MDALTLIEQHLDVEKLLLHYDFDGVKGDGGMIRACCKLHGGNNPTSFVINRDTGLWYCHTGGCGGGSIYMLVQTLEDISFPEAVKRVADIMGIDIENLEILEQKASYVDEVKQWVRTMKARTSHKVNVEYQINEPLRDVTKFRDFRLDTLEHFGLKYVEKIDLVSREGKPYALHHRLVFPIIQNGTIIGASIRRIKSTDYPKWSHQPQHLETSEILYNYDAVQGLSTIVITEGIVDVWAYHEIGLPAVATFGAHLTETQYRLLMRTGADLVWSYDGDEAGCKATEKALSLFRNKANNYCISFEPHEDPANITREELAKRYVEKKRCV